MVVEGDPKCPAKSNKRNGLEIYRMFLQTVAQFQELQALPVSIKFNEKHK